MNDLDQLMQSEVGGNVGCKITAELLEYNRFIWSFLVQIIPVMLLIEDRHSEFESLPSDDSAVWNAICMRVKRPPITQRKRAPLNRLYGSPNIKNHEAMSQESFNLGFCEDIL